MNFSIIACWVWPLIAGIICGILGYYWGRRSTKDTNIEQNTTADLEACKRKTASLQADLIACNSKLKAARQTPSVAGNTASNTASKASSFAAGAIAGDLTVKTPSVASPLSNSITAVAFDAVAAKAAFGKKRIKADDLTVVEGIGPKISELFHNHDITTWAALGSTSVEKCQEVLNSGGKRFEIHRPGTWPMQAEMAALGQWSKLKKWQDEHDYGKA